MRHSGEIDLAVAIQKQTFNDFETLINLLNKEYNFNTTLDYIRRAEGGQIEAADLLTYISMMSSLSGYGTGGSIYSHDETVIIHQKLNAIKSLFSKFNFFDVFNPGISSHATIQSLCVFTLSIDCVLKGSPAGWRRLISDPAGVDPETGSHQSDAQISAEQHFSINRVPLYIDSENRKSSGRRMRAMIKKISDFKGGIERARAAMHGATSRQKIGKQQAYDAQSAAA